MSATEAVYQENKIAFGNTSSHLCILLIALDDRVVMSDIVRFLIRSVNSQLDVVSESFSMEATCLRKAQKLLRVVRKAVKNIRYRGAS